MCVCVYVYVYIYICVCVSMDYLRQKNKDAYTNTMQKKIRERRLICNTCNCWMITPCKGLKHCAVTINWEGREGLACRLASICSLFPTSGEMVTRVRMCVCVCVCEERARAGTEEGAARGAGAGGGEVVEEEHGCDEG